MTRGENWEKFKKFWKKFWFIVWKDNSFKGWIISIIFLFVIIKFVFFPLLDLATGTKLPLVIVESCSMYHKGHFLSNFNSWYDAHQAKYLSIEISKDRFAKFSMKKEFAKGDILFVVGVKPERVKIGNVIIFNANYSNPIIHRVVQINQTHEGEYVFSTLGDNNNGQLNLEKQIYSDQIIGKAVFNIVPYLGWAKLVFFEFRKAPQERGFCKEN
jgi:signal peptidase I